MWSCLHWGYPDSSAGTINGHFDGLCLRSKTSGTRDILECRE